MQTLVSSKVCGSCKYCIKQYYAYYTHDNRLVEYYTQHCLKKGITVNDITPMTSCYDWERNREIKGN